MTRHILVLLFLSALLLPANAFAETGELYPQSDSQNLHQIAEKIISLEFETLTIKVRASSRSEAIVKSAYKVREYLDSCRISPLICAYLNTVSFVVNQEYEFLKSCIAEITFFDSKKQSQQFELRLDKIKLRQMALIWAVLSTGLSFEDVAQ